MPTVQRQADHNTSSHFLQSSSKPGQVHVVTKRVLQNLAMIICDAKGLSNQKQGHWYSHQEMVPNPGLEVPLAWLLREIAYWVGGMTCNFHPVSANEADILKSSKTQE
ncbi:hypothetical protein PoB_001707300 [Plakobranchus ocellatus]|uniref:Uncharacterized protein n=1 Tax=Plakobranchus ocellatus TaxID=259542 RepID=A0AAV3Z7H0_9GAST|nr:hypothetical protein PoB_001707300 [Plakobranchus ocellatus]